MTFSFQLNQSSNVKRVKRERAQRLVSAEIKMVEVFLDRP